MVCITSVVPTIKIINRLPAPLHVGSYVGFLSEAKGNYDHSSFSTQNEHDAR